MSEKEEARKQKLLTKYVLPPTQSLVLKQMDSLKTLRVNTQNFCMNNLTKTFYVGMGDSHIADFEYHEIPQVVKVITSVVLGLSRVAAGHE